MADLTSPTIKQRREFDGALVLSLAGDVDLNSSAALRADLLSLADAKPRRIVINLSGVNYMDSSGVAALVELLSRTKRNKTELLLCSLGMRVRSVFEIARLDKIFVIVPTEQEALA